MIRWFGKKRYGPIGVDLGTRTVKLVQLSADAAQLVEAARWDLPAATQEKPAEKPDPDAQANRLVEALRQARAGRNFHGREAVLCLSDRELFTQNIRVAKAEPAELARLVQQETAGRVPFPVQEAEIRFI